MHMQKLKYITYPINFIWLAIVFFLKKYHYRKHLVQLLRVLSPQKLQICPPKKILK